MQHKNTCKIFPRIAHTCTSLEKLRSKAFQRLCNISDIDSGVGEKKCVLREFHVLRNQVMSLAWLRLYLFLLTALDTVYDIHRLQ